MWPHQRLEERMAERLLRRMEPQLENILNEFLSTAEGQKLVIDAIADLVSDFATVPRDVNVLSMPEQIILSMAERMADRPLFRQRLMRILETQAKV